MVSGRVEEKQTRKMQPGGVLPEDDLRGGVMKGTMGKREKNLSQWSQRGERMTFSHRIQSNTCTERETKPHGEGAIQRKPKILSERRRIIGEMTRRKKTFTVLCRKARDGENTLKKRSCSTVMGTTSEHLGGGRRILFYA